MPYRITWTPELIARFWDGVAQSAALDAMSFENLAGLVLIEQLQPWLTAGARCLNFGGGSGRLTRLLVEAGIPTAHFEPSVNRAQLVAQELQDHPLFLGCIGLDTATTFDVVICTEVIEHILEGERDVFMAALASAVAPGGRLILTTPYNENLGNSMVYCPVCDSTFHRWQHQRAWDIPELRTLLAHWHMEEEWIGLVGYDDIGPIREFNLKYRLREPWGRMYDLADGTRIPVLGSGDRIFFVGRRVGHLVETAAASVLANVRDSTEPPLFVARPAVAETVQAHDVQAKPHTIDARSLLVRQLQQGLQQVVARGAYPIVVTPKSLQGVVRDAPVVVLGDAFFDPLAVRSQSNGDGTSDTIENSPGGRSDTDAVLVFPGDLSELQHAFEAGLLPQPPSAMVLHEGKWEQVRLRAPSPRQAATHDDYPTLARAWRKVLDRFEPDAIESLRKKIWIRQLQPMVDRREQAILNTLLHPGEFPYRLRSVIEGRILLGIGSLSSGGAERQILNTARGLRERGIRDVHLLVEYLYDSEANAFHLETAREAVASLDVVPASDAGAIGWARQHPMFLDVLTPGLVERIVAAGKVIRRLSPEVVQLSLDWTNITLGIAAVLAGVPHIFISGRNLAPVHFEFFQWFMFPAYRALLKCRNVKLLNNSEAGKYDYAAWLRMNPDDVGVLRNGVRSDHFSCMADGERAAARQALGIADDVPVIAGAFRLSAEKRPFLWLRSAARIKAVRPDTVFLLCGAGPLRDEIERVGRQLGLENNLRMLGTRSDIREIFAAADIVMQTSLQEGTPNTLIEAQALGVAVVTTPAFGAAEAVEHGVTGVVVKSDRPSTIAQAALRILGDNEFRARLAQTGPEFIERRFGFKRMIDDTLLTYTDAGVAWAADALPDELKYRHAMALTQMYAEQGHAYVIDMPEEWAAFTDEAGRSTRSPVEVLEDGKRLGPAHTPHDVIRTTGRGAFSHWANKLYFSTSDNSDPISNGREYKAVVFRANR
ncbi:MAG: glycosyltransferase [Gammaproteobacteria bacterium]|nr:glycosyltransferase [Gammaproteobacteria bacterium]